MTHDIAAARALDVRGRTEQYGAVKRSRNRGRVSNVQSVMRRLTLVLLCFLWAIGLAGPWLAATAASAAATPSLAIAPTSGPAGTTIHVSGTSCPDTSWDTTLHWAVHVQVLPGGSADAALTVTPPNGTPHTPFVYTLEGYPGRADASTSAASDGSWAVDVTVPAIGGLAAVPGTYPVSATCYATEGTEAGTIGYPSQDFTVPAPTPAPQPPAPVPAPPVLTG